MSEIKVKIIADSKSSVDGKRITTFEAEYPRFIHSELMTHRMFSRNAASSRAIPVAKMVEAVRSAPASPIHWGKNQPGMQAKEELDDWNKGLVEGYWDGASHHAARLAEDMNSAGAHKQIVNRILEPFQMMKTVLTATEFDNFFWLRNHCYSDDTEVLTTSGWKPIKDVVKGEVVISLNPETRGLEPAQTIDTVTWKSTGKAVKFEGAAVDLLVSDLHKMLVSENGKLVFKPAKDLIGTNPTVIKNCVPESFDGESIDYKRGKFLGFYLGNGWKYKTEVSGNSGVVVCKGDKHGYDVISTISAIASEIFTGKNVSVYEKAGMYHCKVDGKSVYEEFENYGNALEKDIPGWLWDSSSSYKRGVFDGMLLADSNLLQQSGGLKYYTSSEKLANSFQRLCLELGFSGTLAVDNRVGYVSEGVDSQGSKYKIETKNIGYRVSVNLSRNMPKLKKQPEFVEYDGNFVCLSLDKNHTLYVRRNGKAVWSGNCDAQPEIKRLAELMLEAMSSSEPVLLQPGEWHVPYYEHGKWDDRGGGRDKFCRTLEDALAISSSCCAQVSYRLLDDSIEKARMVYKRLVESSPVHASPFEHQATPMAEGENEWGVSIVNQPAFPLSWEDGITHVDRQGNLWSGNFKGFVQHRQLIPDNVCNNYKENV